MFEVILAPAVVDFYRSANDPLVQKLDRCFTRLEADPRNHNNVKRLTGSLAGLYRYRIGDWRVIYEIDDKLKRVHVLKVAHRGRCMNNSSDLLTVRVY